jgi:hypothetical protein
VSTVCDVVTTLCPLDVTNADHISSTVQAHHCNPHGEFSNMETTHSLNHSVVVTPNKAGEQHGTQFAGVDPTGLLSCVVSGTTYRFRFLLGDMVWNEVLSYIKVLSCCGPTRTKSPRCLFDTMIIHRKAIMPAMEAAPAVTRQLVNGEITWTDVNLTSTANLVLCSLFPPYCALCNVFGSKKYNTPAMNAGELSEHANEVIPKRHCFQSASEVEVRVMGCHYHAALNPGECNIPSTQYVTMPELRWLHEHKWFLEHVDLNDRALQALQLMHQVVPYPMVMDAQLDGSCQPRFTVNLFNNSVPYNSVLSQVDSFNYFGSKYAQANTLSYSLPHSATQVMFRMMLFWTVPVTIEVLHTRYDLSFASVGSSEYQALESCMLQSLE